MAYRGDHLGFHVDKKKKKPTHTHTLYKEQSKGLSITFFSLSNGFVVSNKNNVQTFPIGFYIKFDL